MLILLSLGRWKQYDHKYVNLNVTVEYLRIYFLSLTEKKSIILPLPPSKIPKENNIFFREKKKIQK